MRKHLLLIVLLLTTLSAVQAAKLIVFIVVDGLDTQSMHDMQPYWTQGGLRTLSEEAYQAPVTFPQPVYGGDETTATILTGQTPFYHNYHSDLYFRRSDRKVYQLLSDTRQTGINSKLTLSAEALGCATLADRFRLNEGASAKIYAAGVNPLTTILLAGHAANACCWIENNGWGATTYYPEGLPSVADNMNTKGGFAQTASLVWTNRLDMTSYLRPTAQEKKKNGFSYDCSKYLRRSPAANKLVVNLALELQKAHKLGQREVSDLLLLNLTLLSPATNAARIASAEQEEMYIGLNQDLGYLMEQLEKRVGKANLQLVVIGKPCYGYTETDLQSAGIRLAPFNMDRAAALVGTYLMAIYGHERWVDGGFGNAIYLNRTLIEQKKLSLATIRRQVADFLEEMEGVQKAFPVTDIPLLPGEGEIAKLRNATTRYAGDVMILPNEGCRLMCNETEAFDNVLSREPVVPFLFWSGAYRAYPDLPTPLPATQILKLILE